MKTEEILDLKSAAEIIEMVKKGRFDTLELREKVLKPVIRDTGNIALKALELKAEAEEMLEKAALETSARS